MSAPALSSTSQFDKVEQRQRARKPSHDEIARSYFVSDTFQYVKGRQFRAVALQFPDYLLPDSSIVAQCFQELDANSQEPTRFVILADSSYSPCCVDEVAAQHVGADCVIHYGDACLTPVRQLPVIYVLYSGILAALSIARLSQMIDSSMTGPTLVLSEAHLHSLVECLCTYNERLACFVPECPSTDIKIFPEGLLNSATELVKSPLSCRLLSKECDVQSSNIVYLSENKPCDSILLQATTVTFKKVLIIKLSDLSIEEPKIWLQKRYLYMNMARSAATYGILANNLSIEGLKDIINATQQAIKSAGKKHYTFVVGKPNVPKLANFEVIDVWVVLSCAQGGLIVDCSDFYKPIITPYELHLALQQEIAWTGQWVTDLRDVSRLENMLKSQNTKDDQDAPMFDLVTGKYISTSRPLRALEHVDVESDHEGQSLTQHAASSLTIRSTVSTAAEHLHANRSWSGLGTDFNEALKDSSQGSELTTGRSGTARRYFDLKPVSQALEESSVENVTK